MDLKMELIMKSFFSLFAILFCLAGTAPAANLLPIPQQMGDDPVQIDADTFEVDQKTGWVTAKKNVKIKTGNHELSADHVRLHQESGDVEARGNVIIRQTGFGTWAGEYIEYNYKTGKRARSTLRVCMTTPMFS